MSTPLKDRQQTKVYEWEDCWRTHWTGPRTSISGVRYWARWACNKYGVPAPVVRALKKDAHASYYETNDHVIGVLPNHHAAAVALHEAAHAICWHYFRDLSHGPNFMGVFLYLLEEAKMAPREALRLSADKWGIKWTRLRDVHPKYIRKRV